MEDPVTVASWYVQTLGMLAYDSTLRVPLIAAAPQLKPRTVATTVSLVDLAPSVVRQIGLGSGAMHRANLFRGATYQVWRLSDLKLLETAYFDVGANHYAHIGPQEPRLGPDGSVYVQTLSCGLERITGLSSNDVRSQMVYTFPGDWCGVPTIVGHYLIQSVPSIHGVIVLDITYGAKPPEVARLTMSDTFEPHWTGWDAKTKRLVVTGNQPRLYMSSLWKKAASIFANVLR